jgi:ATP-dependent RNA helicase RhlE
VDRDAKKELLAHLIRQGDWHQVLVFTRMKHGANRLAEYLNKEGITAMAIHGNKSQGARTKALSEFKAGTLQVLVATDIAARGIDIDQLPHVVNYELPNVPEDYVHRIGRTGRAGAQGEAISLVCVDEDLFLRDIEKLIKRSIPREVVAGFEPDPHAKPEPIVLGRMTIGVRGPGGGGGGRRDGGRRDGGRDGHRSHPQGGPRTGTSGGHGQPQPHAPRHGQGGGGARQGQGQGQRRGSGGGGGGGGGGNGARLGSPKRSNG